MTDADIVEKSGAWYSYNGERIGQGKENVKTLLRSNPKLRDELEKKVRDFYNNKNDVVNEKEKKTE